MILAYLQRGLEGHGLPAKAEAEKADVDFCAHRAVEGLYVRPEHDERRDIGKPQRLDMFPALRVHQHLRNNS